MMIRNTLLATIFLSSPIISAAHADNSACWGDESRKDITCVALTEKLLLGLRGRTLDEIRDAMKAPGRYAGLTLHFLSNYSRGEKMGSGDVNFRFDNGRAATISALVDRAHSKGQGMSFIWSAYATPSLGQEIALSTANFTRPALCSDLSGKPEKCDAEGMDSQMTETQTATGTSKAEMRTLLEAACNPESGIAVSDPNGDCSRLRSMLR